MELVLGLWHVLLALDFFLYLNPRKKLEISCKNKREAQNDLLVGLSQPTAILAVKRGKILRRIELAQNSSEMVKLTVIDS